MKIINKILVVLCYVPFLYLATFYLFVLRVTIKIGRVPEYDNPDPKTVGFPMHMLAIDKTLLIVIYSLGVFLILFFIAKGFKKLTINKNHLTVLVLSVIYIVMHFWVDPFFAWYVD